MSEPLKIGDRVRVRGFISREGGPRGNERLWVRYPYPEPQDCWVVGQRTLSDGEIETISETGYFDTATWTEYRPTRFFNAYLVTSGLRHGILRALPEDVELVDG